MTEELSEQDVKNCQLFKAACLMKTNIINAEIKMSRVLDEYVVGVIIRLVHCLEVVEYHTFDNDDDALSMYNTMVYKYYTMAKQNGGVRPFW